MYNCAEALKYQREVAGLSQSTLAKLTGISQQKISYYESGKHSPPIEDCLRLADFYEITLDELVGRDFPNDGSNLRGTKYHIGIINNNGNIDIK